MATRLAGKTALVTGATSNIGRAIATAFAPGMAERGDGAIVNLGSWVARLGIPVGALYASTKGAMQTLTRARSAEFGPAGVRVNAISPA